MPNTAVAANAADVDELHRLQRECVVLRTQLADRDERLISLERDVEHWRSIAQLQETRRPSIHRQTQTVQTPTADAAVNATVVGLTSDALICLQGGAFTTSASTSLVDGMGASRRDNGCIAGGAAGSDTSEVAVPANRAPVLHVYRKDSTPSQLVPRLDLGASPRDASASYGGQLSYRALHQLPSGEYAHTAYVATPRDGVFRSKLLGGRGSVAETPREPVRPLQIVDSTQNTPRMATSRNPSALPPSNGMQPPALVSPRFAFDIDPEGGCGLCQLANQALQYIETSVSPVGSPRLGFLSWLVEDLSRFADVNVGYMSADEHAALSLTLDPPVETTPTPSDVVVVAAVPLEPKPLADILCRPCAVHSAPAIEPFSPSFQRDVMLFATPASDVATVPARLSVNGRGIGLISATAAGPSSDCSPHVVACFAVRCCAVKCLRYPKGGRFRLTALLPLESGAPAAVFYWPAPTTDGATPVNTIQFVVSAQDVVAVKQQLDVVSATCAHHSTEALRVAAAPLTIAANALMRQKI